LAVVVAEWASLREEMKVAIEAMVKAAKAGGNP
jgi:hypothetical protein